MRQIAGLVGTTLGLLLLAWSIYLAWKAAAEPDKSDLGQEGLIIYSLVFGGVAVAFLFLGWLGLRRRD